MKHRKTLLLFFFLISFVGMSAQYHNPFDVAPPSDKTEVQKKKKEKRSFFNWKKKKEDKEIHPPQASLDSFKSVQKNIPAAPSSEEVLVLITETPLANKSIDSSVSRQIETITEIQEEPYIKLPNDSIKSGLANPFAIVNRASEEIITNLKAKRSLRQKRTRDSVSASDILNPNTKDPSSSQENSNSNKVTDSRVTVIYETLNNPDLILDDDVSASSSSNIFLFWFLLIITLAYAIIIYLERTMISQVFRALSNNNFLDFLFRKKNNNNNFIYSILYILFFLNLGLFVSLFFSHFTQIHGLKNLVFSIMGVTCVYMLKHFIILGVGWVFSIQRVMNAYSFTIIIFNVVLGILFIPINYFIAFSDLRTSKITIYTGLTVLILMVLLRSLRTIMMSIPLAGRSQFHFILYLCTIEIFPILVLLKVLAI